jgi:hypothetical protein
MNQLVKAGVVDDVFSLCFGMVEGDGALLLGDAGGPLPWFGLGWFGLVWTIAAAPFGFAGEVNL